MKKVICPSCGRSDASVRDVPEYLYVESGLEGVRLKGGVTETTCRACGESSLRIEKEWQLLQLIAIGLLAKPGSLTGPEMKFLRGACQLTQDQLAERLLCRRPTISERESKEEPNLSPGDELWLRARMLGAFRHHLAQPGCNFLSDRQRAQLDKLERTFVQTTDNVVHLLKAKFTAELSARHRDWRLERAA
jgi:transcriptional regulator with XRE-family HTH domain